jgi:uncharacterized membrane protein
MSWSLRRMLGSTPVSTTGAAESTNAQDRLLPTGRLEAFSDGVFAIAITLLVIELHVPTGHEALVQGLEHEWPRYLGYFVSFAFIGGVWIAHSNMTRFIKASDPDLMRLNLVLLLFVSFLPFTTAIAATHLFASNLSFHELTVSSLAERVAVVLFGLDLTLAALMLYLMLRHAGRTPEVAADDLAEEELKTSPHNAAQLCCYKPVPPLSESSCRCSPWSSTWHWRFSTSSILSGSCVPAGAAAPGERQSRGHRPALIRLPAWSGRSDRWMKRPVANAVLTTGAGMRGQSSTWDVAADRQSALAAWPHGDAQGCCLLRISEQHSGRSAPE